MKTFILGLCLMFVTCVAHSTNNEQIKQKEPISLKTENLINPIGIGDANPRFSWIDTSLERGWRQSAYQIIVASSEADIETNTGDMWNSGKVASSAQWGIKYAGTALQPGTKYWWKVRVYDQKGNVSSYSSAATFETGLFSWQLSSWIGGDYYLLRDDFVLDSTKQIASARLYIASLGWNEVYLNGEKVGNDVLNTGYTELDKRVLYATYDVKELLSSSKNGIGIWLGSGNYGKLVCPALGIPFQKAARLKLRVTYTDGTSFNLGTNPKQWKALKGGPITYDDIYNGEHYDATREMAWSDYGFDDSNWPAPKAILYSGAITPQYTSIKVAEDIPPVSIKKIRGEGPLGYTLCAQELDTVNFTTPADVAFGANGTYIYKSGQTGNVVFSTSWFGSDPTPGVRKLGFYKNASGTIPTYMVDMGKSMAGWLKITLNGPRGSKVQLRYAENVKTNGNLEPTDLRSAKQTDTYILKGGGTEVYEPRFTYHGFRYVEISGISSDMTFSVTGRAIRNDYTTNQVLTSSANMNKILTGVRGGVLANSVAVLTDVSSRDERSTSGGDAFLSVESNLLNFGMQTFYEKCVDDVDYEQEDNGMVPDCCPSYNWPRFTSVAWMSHRILIPWDLFMATGDTTILASHYVKMKQAVDYLVSIAPKGYLGLPNANGDWVPAGATESNQFFADAFFYRNVDLLARMAGVLGHSTDVAKYSTVAANIKKAFNAAYFKSNSFYGTNTQAGNAVALEFDLVPPEYKNNVIKSLVKTVTSNNYHFTTGILGTKALVEALWQNNRSDLVFRLLNQTDYPSFLDMMKTNGITAEHWNPDAYIGSGMNSYNHHMFGGGPGAWMVKGVVGISPAQPGYEQILIRPEVVGDLTSGNGSIATPKGQVSSSWRKVSNTQFNLNVTIPANSTAIVSIPTLGGKSVRITEGGVAIYNNGFVTGRSGIKGVQSTANGRIAFYVGSGSYSFVMTSKDATQPEYTYQPFIMDGTCEWQSLAWRFGVDKPEVNRRVISKDDSVYQGKTYKIIYDYPSCATDKESKVYVGLIREENKRVYCAGVNMAAEHPDAETLLYDFNLNVGDIMNYRWGSFKVSRIDTVLSFDTWRRMYHFVYADNPEYEVVDYWLEGIGTAMYYGVLDPLTEMPECCDISIPCVTHGIDFLYKANTEVDCPCSTLSSQPDVEEVSRFSFFVRDRQLYIHASDQTYTTLKIYCSEGKLVNSMNISEQTNEITSSLERLPKGSYLFVVGSADSQQSGQFIVQ